MPRITAELRAGNADSKAVWHPTPAGDRMLWLWDGHRWLDPIAELEEQITALVIPHLEDVFIEGFKAGWEAAQ